MNEALLEILVEEIMRKYHMRNYEEYASEELREKYRQKILNEEKEKSNASRKNLWKNGASRRTF